MENTSTYKSRILNKIKETTERGKGLTLNFINKTTSIPIQTISARLSDLEDSGVIYKKKRKGAFSLYYYEPCEKKQKENREKVQNEKFIRWIKKGEDFKDLMGEGMHNRLIALSLYKK